MAQRPLITVFSPSGDSLAVAASDGIIRVYDTGTGRLRVALGNADNKASKGKSLGQANGHLVEKYTCAAWATAGRKKQKKTSTWSHLLVVGTAAGDVKAYDTQLGELKWRAEGCIEGGVSALVHSQAMPGVVYVTGASGQVATLSIESGQVQETFKASKHAITCLAVSSDSEHALYGASTLSLWHLTGKERTAKFTGHAMPASCAVFAPDSSAAATCSSGERQVTLWATPAAAATHLDKPSKQKGLQPAAAILTLDHPAAQLDVCGQGSGSQQGDGAAVNGHGPASSSSFCLCAVSTAGEAYVWLCKPGQQQGQLEAGLLSRVQIQQQQGSEGVQDTILAAKLIQGKPGPSLLVVRGSSARPVFDSVQLAAHPGAEPSRVQLQPLPSGALMAAGAAAAVKSVKQVKGSAKEDVMVLGPGANQGAAAVMRTERVAGLAAAGGDAHMVDAQSHEQGDEEVEDDEEEDGLPAESRQPLGDRVSALQAAAGGALAAEAAQEGAAAPQASDKANSLAVLLTQALRSNDRVLLERCLSTSNSSVIVNTVARLLPLDAAAFLRAAVDRLLASPARAGQLAPWVKAVLHHHTGYIMSAPSAQAPLTALYQAIDARVSSYQQLLRLHGRLGLVTTHSRAAQRVTDAAGGTGVDRSIGPLQPEVVFDEGDEGEEDDVDVEDPFAVASDSDGDEGSEMSDEEEDDGDGYGDMSGDDDDDHEGDDDE